MKRALAYAISLSVVFALFAQPAIAQDRTRVAHQVETNVQRASAAFGGVTLKVPFGGHAARKPSLRLQATRTSSVKDTQQVHADRASGFEIGFNGSRKPVLFIGGQDIAEVERELKMRGETGTVLLVAGTVALIALVIVAMKGRAATAGLG